MNIDTTDIKVDKSTDAFAQMATYSGDRGKGHCILMSNLTCPAGTVLAVSPANNSCSPRCGDNVSLGVQLRLANERQQQTNTTQGFTKLLKGTAPSQLSPGLGVAANVDRGYTYTPHNVNTQSNPSFPDYCAQNDILLLTRYRDGECAFEYNPVTDMLEKVDGNNDKTRTVNSGRLATVNRCASENMHTIKEELQNFKGRIHHSRVIAVGRKKIRFYNLKYNKNYGEEWEEQPFVTVEYLVAVGIWNWFRTKFFRYVM